MLFFMEVRARVVKFRKSCIQLVRIKVPSLHSVGWHIRLSLFSRASNQELTFNQHRCKSSPPSCVYLLKTGNTVQVIQLKLTCIFVAGDTLATTFNSLASLSPTFR